jgi:hypothetical protein
MGGRSAMQNAGGMAGDATPFGHATGFPDKAWASLAATGGMLLMFFAYWALETYGPSSRVVFLDYLPLRDARNYSVAAALGAWLGARGFRLFRSGMSYSSTRLMVGCLLGGALGLIVAGLLMLLFVYVLYAAGIHPGVPLASAAMVSAVIIRRRGVAVRDCSVQIERANKTGVLRVAPVDYRGVCRRLAYPPSIRGFPEPRQHRGARSVGQAEYTPVRVLDAHR